MHVWHPDVTEMLMGTEVPPRKAFIYESMQQMQNLIYKVG